LKALDAATVRGVGWGVIGNVVCVGSQGGRRGKGTCGFEMTEGFFLFAVHGRPIRCFCLSEAKPEKRMQAHFV